MTVHRDGQRIKPKFTVSQLVPVDDDVWTFAGKPMPIIYEDEGQDEMGDANLHTEASEILHVGIKAHVRRGRRFQAFANLNCYYSPIDLRAYFSSDVMIVEPFELLPDDLTSYRIGTDGAAPRLAIEILSQRSYQQRDLSDKPIIYGQLGVAEYILADLTGTFLFERLLLKKRRRNGTWIDSQDPDGGVTSKLGFRIIIDSDNLFRVVDAATGTRYLRPDEAQAAEEGRLKAEEGRQKAEEARQHAEKERAEETKTRKQVEHRLRELEAEVARLRNPRPGP